MLGFALSKIPARVLAAFGISLVFGAATASDRVHLEVAVWSMKTQRNWHCLGRPFKGERNWSQRLVRIVKVERPSEAL
jgi:hypothetical protein